MKEMILGQLLESKGKIHKERLTASTFEESTNEISDSFGIINSSKCKTNTNKIFRKIEGFETKARQSNITKKSLACNLINARTNTRHEK